MMLSLEASAFDQPTVAGMESRDPAGLHTECRRMHFIHKRILTKIYSTPQAWSRETCWPS